MGSNFRRNLTELEENQLFSHLDTLSHIHVSEGEDNRVWIASTDGSFSVKSFFLAISNGIPSISSLSTIWKIKASPRVLAFGWLASKGGILTMDNLR